MTKLSHRKILLLFLFTPVLLFIELAVGFAVFANIRDMRGVETQNSKLDTYLRTNTKYISQAESAQRGYLLTGDAKYKETFANSLAELQKNELYGDTVRIDTKDKAISRIHGISERKVAEMSQTILLHDAGQKGAAIDLVKTNTGKLMMDSLRTATTSIRTGITGQVTKQRQTETRLFIIFFVVIAVLILFNLFLVYYTYTKFTEYAHKLEDAVDSLEEANGRMRQYTSMSYHELKTPLRNIHGFAQLLKSRHMAGDDDSEEEQFIRYITDGIRQMNSTINSMRDKYLDTVND